MQKPALGIIFDMDGVLVDSYASHLESWRQLAAEHGRTLTDAQIGSTFGRTSRDIIRLLFEVEDPGEIHKLDQRKESLYRDLIRGRVPAMPGAVELVNACRDAGFKLAVGSSGPSENVSLVCNGMGLRGLFDAIVTGDDITHGKPDPEVFLTAAARLDVKPQLCVVIEDAPVGVAAARNAGMKCVGLVGTYPRETLKDATAIAESLNEIGVKMLSGLF